MKMEWYYVPFRQSAYTLFYYCAFKCLNLQASRYAKQTERYAMKGILTKL